MVDRLRDDLKTEEDVKVKVLLPFLEERGYKISHCDFEKAIEVQEGRKRKNIFADVVVYTSSHKNAPLILCETKPPNDPLDRFTKDQTISYARLLPRIAPLALITNGSEWQVFQTISKNRLPDLPHRKQLQQDIVDFIISKDLQDALRAEAKHVLFIIDDVETFKSILKSCHNEIRNNEGYDPTAAFDEMSKVLFCKMYEEKHGGNTRFRLSLFDESLERFRVNVVRQIFDETKRDPRYVGLFEPDITINLQDRTIRKIVSLFENYDLSLTAFDVKGEAFEYFLGDTFTGGLGEYFTPRNIVEFIVDAINPKIGERIIDPFCGTGGFLIYAFEVVGEKIRLQEFSEEEKRRWRLELSSRCLFGTDWKPRTSQACKMNMMVHGDGSTGVFMHHGLVNVEGKFQEGEFDICLTNPPFGSNENDDEILRHYDLGKTRSSQDRVILALERAVRLVRGGGWVGIIVIDGILNNFTTRYVRNYVKKHAWVKAIISLAKETFEGYGARAKTSILLLQKKQEPDEEGQQHPVFMAIAQNTGYAPNGAPIPGNELGTILMDYRAFLRREPLQYHPNAWEAEVQDRLDAEFYWKRSITPGSDLNSLRGQVGTLLSKGNEVYAEIERLLSQVTNSEEYETIPLSHLLEEIQVKEKLDPQQHYRLLGVRWWGAGTFIREEKLGRQIKSTALYRVSGGWVIYNRLFAYRGSFATVAPEHEGCYVSGEFPTFIMKSGVEEPEFVARYLVHYLNSPSCLQTVEVISTGSTKTSRSRFNQSHLLSFQVSIPKSHERLRQFVELLDRVDALRQNEQQLLERVKDLRSGVTQLLPRV